MGNEERKEMLFWTKAEYQNFSEAVMDKPISFYAFEVLYWTGIREGELLALTPADFDFEKQTLKINKSYQRLHGEDVITSPKTPRSNRTIQIPKFLADEMQEFFSMQYEGNDNSDKAAKAEGIRFEIAYNDKYNDEYSKLVAEKKMQSLPIEYYEVSWSSFARDSITTRSIPIKSAMIDSSSYFYPHRRILRLFSCHVLFHMLLRSVLVLLLSAFSSSPLVFFSPSLILPQTPFVVYYLFGLI